MNEMTDIHNYIEGKYLVHDLGFYDELDDALFALMNELETSAKSPPIARYYIDGTGDTLFYTFIDNELMEFEDIIDAEYAWENLKDGNVSDAPNAIYRKGKTSLIRLQLKKNQTDKIHDLLLSLVDSDLDVSEITKLVKPIIYKRAESDGNYEVNSQDAQWNGNLERIVPYFKSVYKKGTHITLGFDIFDVDLFGNYPSKEQVQTEIKENIETNQEMGMDILATEPTDVVIKLQNGVLYDSVERLMIYLLTTDGVSNINTKLRHKVLDKNTEIHAEGGQKELYYCMSDGISNDKGWIDC